MTIYHKLLSSIICATIGSSAFANIPEVGDADTLSNTWNLKRCIGYALEHNIQIQQKKLATDNSRITLQTSKYSRVPNLNASVGQGFGFGRSTGRDGATVDKTSGTTNFSVSSSVPLFTGFRIPNQIKSDEYNLKASLESFNQAKQDISINIATFYLNALYYQGLEQVYAQQVELGKEQLATAIALVETGKKAASERYEAEAQLASSEYTLTQAIGNSRIALLNLTQALNLEQNITFSIAEPDTTSIFSGDIPLPDAVFAMAAQTHPSILASMYQLESSKHSLNVTKSNYYPSLSLNASYSNGYYHTFNQSNTSFHDQLDLNGSEYIGISLNIPIFNRFATRNSVRQARLNIENQQLALNDARNNLYKEIQQAYCNAANARNQFASAQKAAASNRIAYQYEYEKYASGKSTSYDLNSAKTKLEKALQDALQAKYEYLLRMKILDYYNGIPLK